MYSCFVILILLYTNHKRESKTCMRNESFSEKGIRDKESNITAETFIQFKREKRMEEIEREGTEIILDKNGFLHSIEYNVFYIYLVFGYVHMMNSSV